MSADDAIGRADAPWRATGQGHYSLFKCALCQKDKSMFGRRLKRVPGLIERTWVCAKCAGVEQ